jgi:hypothetical protein
MVGDAFLQARVTRKTLTTGLLYIENTNHTRKEMKSTKTTTNTPLQRILKGARPWQYVLWWLIRICFFYGLVCTICWKTGVSAPWIFPQPAQVPADKMLTMMIVYVPLTFVWEIFQFLPEDNIFRGAPCYFQNLSAPFALATGFCGAFLNFYYDVWWWDKAIHVLGGGMAVILGYEVCAGIQRKRKTALSLTVVLLFAAGMSFIVGTGWEMFEFSFDQFFGGDTQHWNVEMAQEAGIALHVFPPPAPGGPGGPLAWQWEHRWALMDTMGDMIMNTLGAVIFTVALRIFPYSHRGKNNLNTKYAQKATTE